MIMKTFLLNEDGFCGTFYQGTTYFEKAIIFMSGSGISQKQAQLSASFLVKQGYSVLVLGFYKWRGLPREMFGIPVEYVHSAINWLLSYQEQRIKKIAIMGTSTGAGYALLCASLLTEISCVIAISPFDHVMEGVDRKFRKTYRSTYTYKGQDIAFTPNTLLNNRILSILRQAKNNKKYTLRRSMRYFYDMNPPIPSSRIKIENMKSDLLLIAAQDDDMWPAEEAACRMEEILIKSNHPYRVKTIVYEKASHLLGYIPPLNLLNKILVRTALLAEKNYPKECENARKDSVRQILLFLAEW